MTGGTFLDPTGARGGAAKLTTAAETLASAWATTKSQIEGLHGSSPWGTDEAGVEFNKHYLDGGDKAPAAATLAAAEELITRLRQLGPDIKEAVEGTVDADELVASWFRAPGGGA
jgi:hypothetical protein